jgi:putative transposase
MGVASFVAGAIVRIDGSEYRLLRKVSETLWQLEHIRTLRLCEYEENQLLILFSDAKLTFANSNARSVQHHHREATQEQLTIAKLRLKYVIAAADLPNTRATLGAAIRDLWNEVKEPARPPGYITVYRWKRRYRAAGNDIRALVDNSHLKGNRDSRYPHEVVAICTDSIQRVYMTRERRTVQDAFDNARIRMIEENKQRPPDLALPIPGRRLIQRLINNVPAIDRFSARHGRDAALREFRSAGRRLRVADGPLARAEIDHTELDIFVIDDTYGLPIGRPHLTACIDNYTRCILGIYVGFIPPSYESVAKCLKHAFLPKTNLRNQYPGITSEWPAYGVMHELVLDNGLEFHGTSLEQACLTLGITMHFSPRRQPWYKGTIERFFKTVNDSLSHSLPGTSFSSVLERGDYRSADRAAIRLATFNFLIRKGVVDIYHQQPHRALQTSPARMWLSSVKEGDIGVPANPAELDVIMGKPMQRVLTHKGIELDGLFYNCDELQVLRRKKGVKVTVDLRVDVDDISQIFVLPPSPADPIVVPALNIDYARGISQWQHQQFRAYSRTKQCDENGSAWLQAKAELAQKIQEELADRHKTSRKRMARHLENMPLATGTASNVSDRSDFNEDFSVAVRTQPDIDESIFPNVTSEITRVVRKRFTAIIEEEPRHE